MDRPEFRIAITGGRDYSNTKFICAVLNAIAHKAKPSFKIVLVHGGAAGADSIGEAWAQFNSIEDEPHKPNYKISNPKAAPLIRNAEMARSNLDLAVAFPGGNGTAHMISECLKNNVITLDLRDEKIDYEDCVTILKAIKNSKDRCN